MKVYEDGSATLDKWDIRALSELLKKYRTNKATFRDYEVNEMKNRIMKTPIHRFWYWLKYPVIN